MMTRRMVQREIRSIFFDLGNTLIRQVVDSEAPLDQLEVALLPSVGQMLRAAARYWALGIITNTERTDEVGVRECLRRLGISHYFKSVTTSVDVGSKKPSDEMFLRALSKHGEAPARAAMVGNSYDEDIVPAKALGMITVYLGSRATPHTEAPAAADYTAEDAQSLMVLFDAWAAK